MAFKYVLPGADGLDAICQLSLLKLTEVSSLMPSMLSIKAFPKVFWSRTLRATSAEKLDLSIGRGLKIRSFKCISDSSTSQLPEVCRISGAAVCLLQSKIVHHGGSQ